VQDIVFMTESLSPSGLTKPFHVACTRADAQHHEEHFDRHGGFRSDEATKRTMVAGQAATRKRTALFRAERSVTHGQGRTFRADLSRRCTALSPVPISDATASAQLAVPEKIATWRLANSAKVVGLTPNDLWVASSTRDCG